MERTERFYKINELLRAKRVVSFSTLLSALEVSPATPPAGFEILVRATRTQPHCVQPRLGGISCASPMLMVQRAMVAGAVVFLKPIHALLNYAAVGGRAGFSRCPYLYRASWSG